MDMTLEMLDADNKLNGVLHVRVPGIYGRKGNPLPKRMSKLVTEAAEALRNVYRDVVSEGGHLYISDMFRSATEQQKAHEDWKSGRKSAYSPPSCGSVHEAARAIDIDAFDTGIGHKRAREILNRHGWVHIVETLTGPECWHYEFREEVWEEYRRQHGYAAMARAMKEAIGNLVRVADADARSADVRWLQSSLNRILGLELAVDGVYGEGTKQAVSEFQRRFDLQVDGIAGPITRRKMEELLGGTGPSADDERSGGAV